MAWLLSISALNLLSDSNLLSLINVGIPTLCIYFLSINRKRIKQISDKDIRWRHLVFVAVIKNDESECDVGQNVIHLVHVVDGVYHRLVVLEALGGPHAVAARLVSAALSIGIIVVVDIFNLIE